MAGASPFEAAHGEPFFAFTESDETAGSLFDSAMRAGSRLQAQLLLAAVDLSGHRRICDVGGGTGTLLARILAALPEASGTLAELPSVTCRARAVLAEEGVADRAEVVAADFFEHVPGGHDLYVLSAVLHDWSDEDAVRILRSTKAAMDDGARCLVIDFLLPDGPALGLPGEVDMLMLVLARGRERTEADFERLFQAAGLGLNRKIVLLNGAAAFELQA